MALMSARKVEPARHPLDAVVHLPGATAPTLQATLAAALADGTSTLSNVPLVDDTRCLIDALRSLAVPVDRGAMRLGTWQALYLVEHRDAPHQRNVVLHYVGTMDQT